MKILSITVGEFTNQDAVDLLLQFIKQEGTAGSLALPVEEEKSDEPKTTSRQSRRSVDGKGADAPEGDGSSAEAGGREPGAESGDGEAPSPRRRRSSRAKGAEGGGETEAKPARRARRSRAKAEAPEALSKITDADLTTAASIAAGRITPKRVKEILEEFGVSEVGKLEQGVRQEFIDQLKAAE